MNCLVTGGLGFIGSHISKQLLKEGHVAYVLDNLHTGKEANLGNGAIFKKASVVEIGALGISDIDVIFHEGIYSSTPMYRKDRRLVSKAISEFIELMEFARKEDARVILASTSSLYNGVPVPQKEDSQISIADFYSEARYCMERLSEIYSHEYGMDVAALRYFSIYGPGERHKGRYANLISQIIWAALSKERFQIYGNGKQTRDFTYIDDVVEANMLAAEFRGFGIFNVGTGKEHSINDIVKKIGEKLEREVEIEYVKNPLSNYVEQTCADTAKAKEVLGFRAKTELDDGIRKCLEYAQK